nr:response regulator [Desulfobulbaceae bacterium]
MSQNNHLNDMSLVELFQLETKSQCANLTNCISTLSIDSPGQTDFTAIQRAIHSIKGAARIVDLQRVISLTSAMEKVLQHSRDQLSSNIELQLCFEECVEQLSCLSQVNPDSIQETIVEHRHDFNRLIRFLEAFAPQSVASSSAPESTRQSKPTDSDNSSNIELFQIFKEDAENHIAILCDNLLEIEKNPTSYALLESSMRTVHSLKGAARVIELHPIVKLTHTMEDLFVAAQEKKLLLNSTQIDVLLTAVDFVKELTYVNKNQVESWLEKYSVKLDSIIKKIKKFLTQDTVEKRSDISSTVPTDSSESPSRPTQLSTASQNSDDTEQRANQPLKNRTLRISAHSISRMMGLAGEAMIESRWLPQFSDKLSRLRRLQDDTYYSIELIKKHLIESGKYTLLEESFTEISKKIGRCRQYLTNQMSDLEDHSVKGINLFHQLHREIINNRMQPLSEGLSGLPRLIRDLGRNQNKDIRFEVVGSGALVDRDILEKIESPLNHIVTNAIDHGIEPPAERKKLGKNPQATIRIEAKHVSGLLHITISDDGRGINFESIREAVIEKNLVSKTIGAALNEYELKEFLFLPSFTTKKTATKTSGRGVGLDVVHSSIREVRGSVQVFSVPGQGTYFELQLPLTLSLIRGIIAYINDEPYSFPLVNVKNVVRLPRSEIKEIGNRQYFITNNTRVGIIAAQQVLDLELRKSNNDILSIIVLESAQHTYGLLVDSFSGIKDLVTQPLNPVLGKLRSVSAAAIADDGTPILILDTHDMVLTMDKLISGERLKKIESDVNSKLTTNSKRILVVDDSVTVREVEKKILSDYGYHIEVAIDGLDAWEKIQKFPYDLIITDIDMPNMDGIELVGQVKDSPEFQNIPIIIVSYKDREIDKNRGLDAGADYYLTKSNFHNQTLIEATEDLIGSPLGGM